MRHRSVRVASEYHIDGPAWQTVEKRDELGIGLAARRVVDVVKALTLAAEMCDQHHEPRTVGAKLPRLAGDDRHRSRNSSASTSCG